MSLEASLLDSKRMDVSRLYGLKFCQHLRSMDSYFATVGANLIFIFKASPLGAELIQRHVDSDVVEDFWACCWASAGAGIPVVVAGGGNGVLKVVSVLDFTTGSLVGHGDAVNEIAMHPQEHHLIFSASKDRSVRMWNLRTMVCVAIFAGDRGHKDDVLCVDVHRLGNCMVSSSVDTAMHIWNLREPALLAAIARSEEVVPGKLTRAFKVLFVQAPLFSTNRIHRGYVDSVKWVGDAVLSKSTNNRMVLWTPDANRYKGAPMILQEYVLRHCDIWFVRADVCIPLGLAAVGNNNGKVYLYSIGPTVGKMQKVAPQEQEQEESDLKVCERFQFEQAPMPCAALSAAE